MSIRTVVYKDVLDARRSKVVWLVGFHYALLLVLFFAQVHVTGPEHASATIEALWGMAFVGGVFVPAIALVAAYLAIAGERESGSIRYLLSTPVTRREVVLGKYVSRATIVAVSLIVGFAVAAILARLWFGSFDPRVFAGIAALTVLYALAYVAVAIGISAISRSRSRAMLGAFGFYVMTNLMTLNDDVSGIAGIEYVLNDLLEFGVGEGGVQFLGIVTNPTRAYLLSILGVFPSEGTAEMALPDPATLPWYVQPEIAMLVLGVWLVVPVVVGRRVFDRADIT
ncbi:ABC transporter [Salinadaptatus halalkaliphilus]|uniref:ABC transporter n=1 Tax=Salinadaptatus halalkaliphilus TaxID=2419781 RepID=A0A4S3TH13_9EURY|nr:ABC transporter permease subunit [Salinadaptatus halalkaliphilus]THE63239.1 ABC transporter [Salinadaptatus halalkaliphilus]